MVFFQGLLLSFNPYIYFCGAGQNHCWLNAMNGIWRNLNQEGIYLILLYQSCGTLNSNSNHSVAFERLKYLQQRQLYINLPALYSTAILNFSNLCPFRYPHLNVFAVQLGSDVSSLAAQSQAVHTIVTEYIAFPILILHKDFSNVRLKPMSIVTLVEKFAEVFFYH